MIVVADKSFQKDTLKLDAASKAQLTKLINHLLQTKSINEIPNFKKIKGFRYAFRIRLGNYRIGIRIEGETIILIRILHRKDIYKYFPFLF